MLCIMDSSVLLLGQYLEELVGSDEPILVIVSFLEHVLDDGIVPVLSYLVDNCFQSFVIE